MSATAETAGETANVADEVSGPVPAPARPRRVVARDGRTIIYYTGHPPPLSQIAGQIRTPSGFTMARRTQEGPSLRPLSSASCASLGDPPKQRAIDVPTGLPGRLLDLLHQLETQGTHLPSCSDLAEELGCGHGAARIFEALDALSSKGSIYYWYGGVKQRHRGQGVVRIAGSDVELRTSRAPPEVHV